MNFLALCQRLRQEAGISGTGPTAVTGQSGMLKRVVDWVTAAYEDIQNRHATWRFLREDFSFSTIASTQEYTPASIPITDHAQWIEEDIRIYQNVGDEFLLHDPPWDEFRLAYMYGSNRTLTGKPIAVAVKPKNNGLHLWPIPDAVYTCAGEYYTIPDVMSADGDTPAFPARFHMAIVWRALMFYGAWAAAMEKYDHGENEFDILFPQLENDQLEQVIYGEPLA